MMQQRIDRLALLNEKQAASPLESRELEELRGKNERCDSPHLPPHHPPQLPVLPCTHGGWVATLSLRCFLPLQPHHAAP